MNDMKLRLGLTLCLTALPVLTLPAQADTREQVMLRLPRCAAIPDTRQDLDCYYAAVAPMRAGGEVHADGAVIYRDGAFLDETGGAA